MQGVLPAEQDPSLWCGFEEVPTGLAAQGCILVVLLAEGGGGLVERTPFRIVGGGFLAALLPICGVFLHPLAVEFSAVGEKSLMADVVGHDGLVPLAVGYAVCGEEVFAVFCGISLAFFRKCKVSFGVGL